LLTLGPCELFKLWFGTRPP